MPLSDLFTNEEDPQNVPTVTVLTHRLASIDGFFIDCLLSDSHTFDSEVTDFPVESGATISDNIRNKPLIVTMECLISNTPLGQLVQLRNKDSTPVDSAYDKLLKIRADRKPVKIFTSLRTYTNMALQSLTIPRESGCGDELKFTATFKQVELVVNKRDKRVAIVGARTGGASTVATRVVKTDGTKYVYINLFTYTWYDFNIEGWREVLEYQFLKPTDLQNQASTHANQGQYVLARGRPRDLTVAEWNARSAAQRSDASVRQALIAKTGHPRAFTFDNYKLKDIVLLSPAQYVFEHPVNESIGLVGPESDTVPAD